MPQLIGAILAIIIAAWVLAVIVWVVQWAAACVFWGWQVILLPFIIYFSPAIIIIVAVIAVYKGSWVAAQNYFVSLRLNVNSDSFLGNFTKYYIISMLTIFLVTMYLAFAIWSTSLIYKPGELFVYHVKDYYEVIVFPAFRIHFPFWD